MKWLKSGAREEGREIKLSLACHSQCRVWGGCILTKECIIHALLSGNDCRHNITVLYPNTSTRQLPPTLCQH